MFFDSLKVACAQNGTSPTSLLKKLGMSTSSVTSWKNGVVPSLKTVYQLAEALGIDPAQLLEGSGEGVIIPASVVRTDAEGRYVWLVVDGKVEKRYISVGGFAGKGISVTQGLEAGEQVITEGTQKVSSGMKVSVMESGR